jgi:hypothetical protein
MGFSPFWGWAAGDVGRAWRCQTSGVAAHLQHAGCPIDILKLQRGDITSPKAQARQKKQDGTSAGATA